MNGLIQCKSISKSYNKITLTKLYKPVQVKYIKPIKQKKSQKESIT